MITPFGTAKREMTFAGEPVDPHRATEILDGSVQRVEDLSREQAMRIRSAFWTIGDLVVPKRGPFAGMPLAFYGFRVRGVDPVTRLPAGPVTLLVVESVAPNGTSTGLRFTLPFDEV